MQHKIQIVVRVLLGALFLFGGVAFFFMTPPPLSGDMATFFTGLSSSHYFFYLLKGAEITCGLCLVSGLFVPLALVVLAPIVLNIFMVHIFLDRSGLPLAIVIGVAMIYLAFFSPSYSPVIKKLFSMKASCPKCGMPQNKWRANQGQGFQTSSGEVCCCQGCAEDKGCTCKAS